MSRVTCNALPPTLITWQNVKVNIYFQYFLKQKHSDNLQVYILQKEVRY